MKFLVLISVLSISVYMCAGFSAEVCQWQDARDDLLGKLSPEGQEAATEILESLQLITYAALQPLYEHLGAKYEKELKAINASADASKLDLLGDLLGVGNYTFGEGPLHDSCQDAKDLEALANSFSPANKVVVMKILEDVATGVHVGAKSLMAVNYVINLNSYEQLVDEDISTLEALAKLYGY